MESFCCSPNHLMLLFSKFVNRRLKDERYPCPGRLSGKSSLPFQEFSFIYIYTPKGQIFPCLNGDLPVSPLPPLVGLIEASSHKVCNV